MTAPKTALLGYMHAWFGSRYYPEIIRLLAEDVDEDHVAALEMDRFIIPDRCILNDTTEMAQHLGHGAVSVWLLQIESDLAQLERRIRRLQVMHVACERYLERRNG